MKERIDAGGVPLFGLGRGPGITGRTACTGRIDGLARPRSTSA